MRYAGYTALVVEDDPQVRALVGSWLKRLGFSVLEASTGVKGLQAVDDSKEPIALLVTDLALPDMHGVRVARQCMGLYHSVRVLVVSGWKEAGTLDTTALLPGSAFLKKPLDRVSFEACLDAMFSAQPQADD
jgi:CheY-like chemotaxis protein